MEAARPRLFDQVREAIRARHYSRRTGPGSSCFPPHASVATRGGGLRLAFTSMSQPCNERWRRPRAGPALHLPPALLWPDSEVRRSRPPPHPHRSRLTPPTPAASRSHQPADSEAHRRERRLGRFQRWPRATRGDCRRAARRCRRRSHSHHGTCRDHLRLSHLGVGRVRTSGATMARSQPLTPTTDALDSCALSRETSCQVARDGRMEGHGGPLSRKLDGRPEAAG